VSEIDIFATAFDLLHYKPRCTKSKGVMVQASSSKPKKLVTGGDDLDDGLELDPTLLASSDAEEEGGDEGGQLNDEEEELLPGDDRVDGDEDVRAGVKRKAGEDDDDEDGDEGDAKAEKKKRRKEREKERKAKVS